MALSNIFREPRREITESVIGIAFFAAFLFVDSYFARWFHGITGGDQHGGCPVPIGYVFGIFGFGVLWIILGVTHGIGENICNALARRGLELRPKDRK